jgi:predicted small lipoprotein YifL
MKTDLRSALVVCALAVLVACGAKGPPMPPSLELPHPPEDFSAARKADRITLSWTPPDRTTDGANVRGKRLGPTLVCQGINEYPIAKCSQIIGQVPATPPPKLARGQKRIPLPRATYSETLPADLQQMYPTGFATYSVQVMNWRWRTAGLSNQVRVPLAPTLAPPQAAQVEVTADGIMVGFGCPGPERTEAGLRYLCRVFRQEPDSNVRVVIQDVPWNSPDCVRAAGGNASQCRATDRGFEWEETYRYWVTPVTEVLQNGSKIAEVEGEDSPPVVVLAHDIFPPAVPGGLEAVASGVGQKPFVDLTWAPNSDLDLAGYNLYRREPGTAAWIKVNAQLVTVPAFRDEKVVAGRSYSYSVSAVDSRGNESARSRPAEEPVP